MSQKTRDFLIKLSEDPDLRARFQEDRQAVMDEHEIPAEHQELIRKGDRERLKEEAGLDDATVQMIIF